jgi:cell shape-determining protein MreC
VHLVSVFIKDEKMPKVGDLVVTSGSAQVFPANILVGKIVKVIKNNFYVLPFVNFKNIDYVQVVEKK